jgi:hypothetical protein
MKKSSFPAVMARPVVLALVGMLCLFTAKAQLANTKWKGPIKVPMEGGTMTELQTTWIFQQDTLTIVYADRTMTSDVMTYREDNKTITIRKVSGGVPCSNDAVGKYSYAIKNDQLLITKVEEACTARNDGDVSQPFDRVK